jgi:hypothetical protein
MKPLVTSLAVMLALLIGFPHLLSAQSPPNEDASSTSKTQSEAQTDVWPDGGDGWRLNFTPFLWAASVDGTLAARGIEVDVEASFTDILKNIDFAMMGRMEARKGRWLLFTEGLYLKGSDNIQNSVPLSSSTDLGAIIDGIALNPPKPQPPGVLPPQIEDIVEGLLPGVESTIKDAIITAIQGAEPLPTIDTVDVKMEMVMVEFGAGYQLGQWNFAAERRLSVDGLIGIRYVTAELETKLSMTPGLLEILPTSAKLAQRQDWLDPIIGARVVFALTKRLALGVRGDVGGFGVGSHFTWNLVGLIQYDITPTVAVGGGYRVLDINFSEDSGEDLFKLDAQLRGPGLFATIRF